MIAENNKVYKNRLILDSMVFNLDRFQMGKRLYELEEEVKKEKIDATFRRNRGEPFELPSQDWFSGQVSAQHAPDPVTGLGNTFIYGLTVRDRSEDFKDGFFYALREREIDTLRSWLDEDDDDGLF